MTTRTPGPLGGPHDSHDRLLIAAAAAGDLAGPELARSERLLASCPDCRTLRDELVAIAAATRHIPVPALPAGVDYRITSEQAANLARGALWRRLLRPFGRSGSGTVRPLAATFTTLGLAGLMLAALPTLQLGAGSGAFLTTTSEAPEAVQPTQEPDAVVPGDVRSPVPTDGDTMGGEATVDTSSGYVNVQPSADDKAAPSGRNSAQGGGGGAGASTPPDEETDGPVALFSDDGSGPTPLVLLSVGLLAAGLGLLVLRQVALRQR